MSFDKFKELQENFDQSTENNVEIDKKEFERIIGNLFGTYLVKD